MNRNDLKNKMWDCANRHLSKMYLEFENIGKQILPRIYINKLMKETDKVISEYIKYIAEQKKGVKND